MIGIFFEDINYGLDGGLNAQMLENRNFEMIRADMPEFGKFETEYDGLYGWESHGEAMLAISESDPVSTNNPHFLVCDVLKANAGFTNKAYDGIYLNEGSEYRLSFYAKADTDRTVNVSVILGDEIAFDVDVAITKGGWKSYDLTSKALKTVKKATFKVSVKETGRVFFDFFSLKPNDAVFRLFRKDLANMLKDLKPDFLRFPGGCVVEGGTLESRYDWKRTIGPVVERKFNWSRWAVHKSWLEPEKGPYYYYGQTYEIGFFEYFMLCEYLGCKPVPVVSVGLACQYMTFEKVDVDDPEFEQYIQDAIDLIEFANGPVDSKWGAVRAEMGHSKPFNMEMIGIGNEQWEDENSQFFERYKRFEKRIHEVYPDIKLIGTAGPDVHSDKYSASWKFIRENSKDNPDFVYAVDEHYYVGPDWLIGHNDFYDNYPRDIKVFAGEYACHVGDGSGKYERPDANTLYAALAEAAFMTGLERNQDVVVMASYAPLLSRLGYSQWSPDMIWFDGDTAYATPSYYVQKMFSTNEGTYIKDFRLPATEGIFASAVKTPDGKLVIKAVNTSESNAVLDISSVYSDSDDITVDVTEMTGGKDDFNTINEPDKITPSEAKILLGEALKLKPLSVKVIGF